MLLQNRLTSISELPAAIHLRLWHFTNRECSIIDAARRARTYGLSIDAKLQSELAAVKYPVCFMDFETFAPAVPRLGGMKPYEPIPIQWSVHRQACKGGTLEHSAFLSPDSDDPRRVFIESLFKAVKGARSIVVYGSYENTVLSMLCRWFPDCASKIGSIQSRLVDLSTIIRRNVYCPDFQRSYSIKRVLPAMVPEMSYDGLLVQSGDQVSSIWERLCDVNLASADRMRLRRALLDYCERDTLALAHLVDVLKVVGSFRPQNSGVYGRFKLVSLTGKK